MFKNSSLLICGGTGSFGRTAVRSFLEEGIGEIRILSRDEKKQEEMRHEFSDDRLKFFIGDVRDKDSVERAVRGVHHIFHAAALKQVPSCEFFPVEAVKTNIIGTDNILDAAIKHKVMRAVVLSTDKAVYPINAMGMSKALMEKVAIAKAREVGEGSTKINVTRYGNVMGSRGSVIPLFIDQMATGGPVTITNGQMTRFLMSLDESLELVKFAFEHGNQGDLFVNKAPSTKIQILCDALIKITNYTGDVSTIGIRHGEKLYETLVGREEMGKADELGDYYRVPMDARSLNYRSFEKHGKSAAVAEEFNSDNARQLDVTQVIDLLKSKNILKSDLK